MPKRNNLLRWSIRFFCPAILVLGIAGCEREVHFNLKNEKPKLVVDGAIETHLPPIVRLSKSIGFFSKVNLQTLANSYVHGAHIVVSNGTDSVVLKEYHYNENNVSLYFYTVDTTNPQALIFVGTPGTTYYLTIRSDGKTYTSQTTIPNPDPLDSIWAQTPPPEEMPKNHPDSRLLYAQYTDPDTPGNRIRYFTKINRQPFLPPLYSVYDDQLVNGKTITMPLLSGFNKMDTVNAETFGYFYKGDTVIIKWCAIDKAVYDFWQTLEFSYGSTGNPFSSPVEISTNIKGGALGDWSGYGTSFDTLIIKN